MNTNSKSGLTALAIGTFALGISEFGMMGILSDISRELDISVSRAGHLISLYSLGVAIGAPLLIFMRRMSLKKVLLILSSIIAVGNLLATISPNYGCLLAARFISGLPHGAFFGCGAIVCTRLAAKGHGATAVSIMVGGMTVANVIGVPLATFVCNTLSWRFTFAIIMLVGATAFLAIHRWIPYLSPTPDTGIKGQFRFLKSAAPWLIFGGVFFGQACAYCWLSYVSPIMTHGTGFTTADMTWIMVIIGVGMVCGNLIAGKMADKVSPSLVSATIAAILGVIMVAIYLCVDYRVPSLILAFLASAGLFGIGGPPQFLIVRYSKGGEMLGGAGIQIAFNLSNACSATVGGLVINLGMGVAAPALAGVPFAIIGMACFLMMHHKYKSQGA